MYGSQQWSGEGRERSEHRGGGAGDLHGQRREHQFLRDDGIAEQPVERDVLAAVVQQYGSGYPAQVRDTVIECGLSLKRIKTAIIK